MIPPEAVALVVAAIIFCTLGKLCSLNSQCKRELGVNLKQAGEMANEHKKGSKR